MTLKAARLAVAIAICMLMTAGPAVAQTTANITIDGTFVPPTCAVTIAGGGTLDWGTLTRAVVLAYANYATAPAKTLPSKTTQLSVSCPSPTVIGLSWADNRAATKMPVDVNDPVLFGLTNANSPGQILGGFHVRYTTPTSSTGGAIDRTFIQPETGGAWSTSPPGGANAPITAYLYPAQVTAFGRTVTSTTAPVALLDYTTTLTVQPYVSTAIVTASTSSILMDGSATVTLKYF